MTSISNLKLSITLNNMITQNFLNFRQTANHYNKDTDQNRPCSSIYSNVRPNTTKRSLQDVQDFYDPAIQEQLKNFFLPFFCTVNYQLQCNVGPAKNDVTIQYTKGQIISKADWRAIDSPKKRTVFQVKSLTKSSIVQK